MRLGEVLAPKLSEVGQRIIDYVSTGDRSALEDSLGFAATLHAFVLDKDPRVQSLAQYYASVGGSEDCQVPQFERDLLASMAALGASLFEQAKQWRVQTNETSRGLAWLLPCALLGVDGVHLVELGASAGLNLYAEKRRYELQGEHAGASLVLGDASSTQFVIPTQLGDGASWPTDLKPGSVKVLSRAGVDFSPVDLSCPEARLHLKACVWGDQPQRHQRLQEGFALHQAAVQGALEPAAQMITAELPEDLEGFLRKAVPVHPEAPLVIYNTYVTEYFNDVDERALHRRLSQFARSWSLQHNLPLMWVRFEPPRSGEAAAPRRGWCRWQVELYMGPEHRHVDLGWAHPHFSQLRLDAGMQLLQRFRAPT